MNVLEIEQEKEQLPMPDLVEIPHRPGKEPYVEPTPIKIIAMEAAPIKLFQSSKPIHKEEEMKEMRIDLTQSPPLENL